MGERVGNLEKRDAVYDQSTSFRHHRDSVDGEGRTYGFEQFHAMRVPAGIRTALAPWPLGGWGRSLFQQSVDSDCRWSGPFCSAPRKNERRTCQIGIVARNAEPLKCSLETQRKNASFAMTQAARSFQANT